MVSKVTSFYVALTQPIIYENLMLSKAAVPENNAQ